MEPNIRINTSERVMTGFYVCIRWGSWMIRNGTLYHWVKITFGARGQYTRYDWLPVRFDAGVSA